MERLEATVEEVSQFLRKSYHESLLKLQERYYPFEDLSDKQIIGIFSTYFRNYICGFIEERSFPTRQSKSEILNIPKVCYWEMAPKRDKIIPSRYRPLTKILLSDGNLEISKVTFSSVEFSFFSEEDKDTLKDTLYELKSILKKSQEILNNGVLVLSKYR